MSGATVHWDGAEFVVIDDVGEIGMFSHTHLDHRCSLTMWARPVTFCTRQSLNDGKEQHPNDKLHRHEGEGEFERAKFS
jgi:hypothetical protein